MLGEKLLETNLPAQGVVTLMKQEGEKRYVNHLLYASPVKRGNGAEIIEDILRLYNIEASIKVPKKINKVYLAPQMKELDYKSEDGRVSFVLPELECHQMVVLNIKIPL